MVERFERHGQSKNVLQMCVLKMNLKAAFIKQTHQVECIC
jgi:hypothetical protein